MSGGNHWTAEGDAYLVANYHKESIANIAAHVGRPADAIYARAGRLGLRRVITSPGLGTLAEVFKLAQRPQGVHSSEMPHRSQEQFHCAARNLLKKGQVFHRVFAGRHARYFASEAAMNAYVFKPAFKPAPAVVIKHRAPWPADTPMVITSATKFTYAPKPPERVLRTGTHNVYA